MKEGSYLCTSFHSGYSVEGYVYERDIWLREGLVLTDDNQALLRHNPRPGVYYNELYLRTVNGKQFRIGPSPEVLPSEPLPWYPFCVDGKWGVQHCPSAEIEAEPTLSRKKAEKIFWELENRGFGDDDEDDNDDEEEEN